MKQLLSVLLGVLILGGCSLKTGYEAEPQENIYIGE